MEYHADTGKGGNQSYRVLRYMQTYGSITPVEALSDLCIMRLGARIWDLKHQGFQIKTEIKEGVNRMGEKTRYAKYSLISENVSKEGKNSYGC